MLSLSKHVPMIARVMSRLLLSVATLIPSVLLLLPQLSIAQVLAKSTIAYSAISPIFAGMWMAKEKRESISELRVLRALRGEIDPEAR